MGPACFVQAAIDQFKGFREQQQAIANDDPSFG